MENGVHAAAAREYQQRSPTVLRAHLITHLMKAILGIICIIAGLALFFAGLNRKDSLAGRADRMGTSIANRFDGGVRAPIHVGYMIGGGALVLVGIAVVANRGTRGV